MTMMQFREPLPVIADGHAGYAIYVESGGTFENDIWCVVHRDTGLVRHYLSRQLKVELNGTFGINNPPEVQPVRTIRDCYSS